MILVKQTHGKNLYRDTKVRQGNDEVVRSHLALEPVRRGILRLCVIKRPLSEFGF